MRVLVCPDSFKGTLDSPRAAAHIAGGWRSARPGDEVMELPLGDGGDGTARAVALATRARVRHSSVPGPLGAMVDCEWMELPGGGAFLEMASASGLLLLPPGERDPERTSSLGTGALIRDVLDHGLRNLRIGIGGSATNDGGAGMLQALGARFLDASGAVIREPMSGGLLARAARLDLSGLEARLKDCRIEVACDVDNPLLGPEGASAVFGPQKGATPEAAARLDANLARLVRMAGGAGIDPSLAGLPGAGAAGGMGWALTAFCGAHLVSGIDMVLDMVGFDDRLDAVDLVVTGEGSADAQTLRGKVVAGVLRRASARGVPVMLVAGMIAPDLRANPLPGIAGMHAVMDEAPTLEAAMDPADAAGWLERTAARAAAEASRLFS